MRKTVKTIFLFLSIFLCIIVLFLIRVIFYFFPARKKYLVSCIVHYFGKIYVRILGIKVKITGERSLLKKRGIFFVSNHLSYIDGIVVTSISPLVFIGKSDIKAWPLFGIFSSLSGTIFVNRINPSNIHRELEKIVSVLKSKVNVIIFPEATSTDGSKFLPFKSSFFAAPLKADCPIVPLAIKYKKIDSEAISDKNKDRVYWYGDMKLLPHLREAFKLRSITVEVNVCAALTLSQIKDKNNSSQRKYLSEACWKTIKNQLELAESA